MLNYWMTSSADFYSKPVIVRNCLFIKVVKHLRHLWWHVLRVIWYCGFRWIIHLKIPRNYSKWIWTICHSDCIITPSPGIWFPRPFFWNFDEKKVRQIFPRLIWSILWPYGPLWRKCCWKMIALSSWTVNDRYSYIMQQFNLFFGHVSQ